MLTIIAVSVLLSLVIGFLIAAMIFRKSKPLPPAIHSNVIIDQIEAVFKVVLVESHIGHVYKYEDFKKLLFIDQSKRQLIIVNAKVSLSFDMTKVRAKIDKNKQKVIFYEIPEPEIMVDPDYEFYLTEDSLTNKFSDSERTAILREAKTKIVSNVKESKLIAIANRQAIEMVKSILRLNGMKEWTVELPKSLTEKKLIEHK